MNIGKILCSLPHSLATMLESRFLTGLIQACSPFVREFRYTIPFLSYSTPLFSSPARSDDKSSSHFSAWITTLLLVNHLAIPLAAQHFGSFPSPFTLTTVVKSFHHSFSKVKTGSRILGGLSLLFKPLDFQPLPSCQIYLLTTNKIDYASISYTIWHNRSKPCPSISNVEHDNIFLP